MWLTAICTLNSRDNNSARLPPLITASAEGAPGILLLPNPPLTIMRKNSYRSDSGLTVSVIICKYAIQH